jgi:DNA-binding response OmpR family regulator
MANTTRRTTERTAADAYAEHAAAVDELLARIKTGLQRHAMEFSTTNRKNWGFVGDIAATENSLREIAETMPQVDDSDIVEQA